MTYSTHLLRHLRFTIRAERTRQKMTLRYLSRKSGVPEYLIDQYELGKNEISIEEILKISCVLKLKIRKIIEHQLF